MNLLERISISVALILVVIIIFYQKKQIENLDFQLFYFTRMLKKQQNLLDLIASAMCNPAAKSLYFKLSEIDVMDYPDDHEKMSEIVEKFSHENYNKQREILIGLMEKTHDPEKKHKLQKKLEKYDELKTITSLLDHDASDSYKKTLMDNINRIIAELQDEEENDT